MRRHAPKGGPALTPAQEWARKTQSPVYIRRAKRLARILNHFVEFDRSAGVPKPSRRPSKRRVREILHLFLDTWEIDDRRRRRVKTVGELMTENANAVPTTSLAY